MTEGARELAEKWLAENGYHHTAVTPVAEFAEAYASTAVARGLAEIRKVLAGAVDREVTDETAYQLAVIAANGLHWRGLRIEQAEAEIATAVARERERCVALIRQIAGDTLTGRFLAREFRAAATAEEK